MPAPQRVNGMVEPELWGFFGESANEWEASRDWCYEYMKANSSKTLAGITGFLRMKGFDPSAIQAAFVLYVGE